MMKDSRSGVLKRAHTSDGAPGGGVPDSARSEGVVNERGPLRDHTATTKSVVPNLGVAHVIFGGQADGGSVRLYRSEGRAACLQRV